MCDVRVISRHGQTDKVIKTDRGITKEVIKTEKETKISQYL